jgi:hypothetical protein
LLPNTWGRAEAGTSSRGDAGTCLRTGSCGEPCCSKWRSIKGGLITNNSGRHYCNRFRGHDFGQPKNRTRRGISRGSLGREIRRCAQADPAPPGAPGCEPCELSKNRRPGARPESPRAIPSRDSREEPPRVPPVGRLAFACPTGSRDDSGGSIEHGRAHFQGEFLGQGGRWRRGGGTQGLGIRGWVAILVSVPCHPERSEGSRTDTMAGSSHSCPVAKLRMVPDSPREAPPSLPSSCLPAFVFS